MSRAFLSDRIDDISTGRAIIGATITVREPGTTAPLAALMYAGPTGGTTLANPLTSDAGGRILFYLDQQQAVDLYVTAPGMSPVTVPQNVVTTSDMVTTGGVQTIGGPKTLSSPTINTPAIAGGSWTGGTISGATMVAPSWTAPQMTAPTVTSGQTLIQGGTGALPGLASPSDPNTGVVIPGSDVLGLAAGGVQYMTMSKGHAPATGALVLLARTDADTGIILYVAQGDPVVGSPVLAPAMTVEANVNSIGTGPIGIRSSLTMRTGSGGLGFAGEFTAEGLTGWAAPTLAAGVTGLLAIGIANRTNMSAWGANVKARSKSSATGVVLCGLEVNVQSEPASAPSNRYGVQIVSTTIDTGSGNGVQATGSDIALQIVGKAVADGVGGWRFGAKWKNGILLRNTPGSGGVIADGTWPLDPTVGFVLAVDTTDMTAAPVLDRGIDLVGPGAFPPTFISHSFRTLGMKVTATPRVAIYPSGGEFSPSALLHARHLTTNTPVAYFENDQTSPLGGIVALRGRSNTNRALWLGYHVSDSYATIFGLDTATYTPLVLGGQGNTGGVVFVGDPAVVPIDGAAGRLLHIGGTASTVPLAITGRAVAGGATPGTVVEYMDIMFNGALRRVALF